VATPTQHLAPASEMCVGVGDHFRFDYSIVKKNKSGGCLVISRSQRGGAVPLRNPTALAYKVPAYAVPCSQH